MATAPLILAPNLKSREPDPRGAELLQLHCRQTNENRALVFTSRAPRLKGHTWQFWEFAKQTHYWPRGWLLTAWAFRAGGTRPLIAGQDRLGEGRRGSGSGEEHHARKEAVCTLVTDQASYNEGRWLRNPGELLVSRGGWSEVTAPRSEVHGFTQKGERTFLSRQAPSERRSRLRSGSLGQRPGSCV